MPRVQEGTHTIYLADSFVDGVLSAEKPLYQRPKKVIDFSSLSSLRLTNMMKGIVDEWVFWLLPRKLFRRQHKSGPQELLH